MPHDFEPTEVAQSEDYTIKARQKTGAEIQASETYQVTSNDRPLGIGGELTGIAKRDLNDIHDELANQAQVAKGLALQRMTEIQQDLQSRLNTEPQNQDAIKKQLSFIEVKLRPSNFGALGGYQAALVDYGPIQEFDDFAKAEKHLADHLNGVNTVQPLILETLVTPGETQINNPDDLHLLSRAVASSKVDTLLGTNVLAQEKFGLDADNKPISISLGVDGVGISGDLPNGKSYFLDVDYSSHDIQKGLYDLEVVDYITGQIDRHMGNVFIDPTTGKVKGIDNDLAFPQRNRDAMLADVSNGEMRPKPVLNKPLFMHEETAQKIESLKPDDLRRELSSVKYPGGGNGGHLTDAEIDGAVTRLKEMQDHVRQLRKTGHVVKQFDKNTYTEAVDHQKNSFTQEVSGLKNITAIETNLDTAKRITRIEQAGKTSYVGSVAVESRKNQLGVGLNEAERLDYNGVKLAKNITGLAPRSHTHVEFDKLANAKKEELRNGIKGDFKAQSSTLNDKLAGYDKRLKNLERPGPITALRSLRYGGPAKARQVFGDKRNETLQQMRDLNSKIDTKVNEGLEPLKKDIWKQAEKNVPQQKPEVPKPKLDLNQGQDVQLSEKEGRQLLKSLDKLSGETKQEGLTLNEQEAGELLKSLNKLSNHPKESRRDSLKLNDQEADELLKALDKLSPEQLKQVQTKSETIQITDEQLDQLINDLKSMDVDEPSESVASKLRMNHVGSGSSTQKQPLGERPKLRDAFPELVPDQGQKKEGPKQGSLRV
jgi:hypothetical protein